jgi:hypothetical protein
LPLVGLAEAGTAGIHARISFAFEWVSIVAQEVPARGRPDHGIRGHDEFPDGHPDLALVSATGAARGLLLLLARD